MPLYVIILTRPTLSKVLRIRKVYAEAQELINIMAAGIQLGEDPIKSFQIQEIPEPDSFSINKEVYAVIKNTVGTQYSGEALMGIWQTFEAAWSAALYLDSNEDIDDVSYEVRMMTVI